MTVPLERPFVLDGVEYVVIEDGSGHYLQLPKLTTAQRDALSATEGMMIYNTDTGQVEAYQNGNWSAVGGAGTFTDLTDTPSSYIGRGGDVVVVKNTEDGIETQPWPVTGTVLNVFLSSDAADIGGYYYMYHTETGDTHSEFTSPSLSTGDDQLLWSFVTEAGQPGLNQLALGAYTATLFLKKSGNKDVRIYWKLFKRDTSGNETEILESAVSDHLTTDNSQYLISAYLNEDQVLDPTDRLVLKLYANVSGTGTDVTVTLTMEGDYDSRLTINVLSSAFNLDRLSDVTISSPTDNELLAYDSGSGKWINQTAAEAGLVPGGSDGQIQYNDGGSFGGASGLYWDDVNSRLGMHSPSPQTDVVVGAGKEFAVEMQTPQNVTATTSEGGTLNGTYYYKISAGDGTGWTVPSAEVSATVDGGTTAGTITISWDAVPGASIYRVWRGTSSGGQNEYYETAAISLNDDGSLTFTTGTPPSVTNAYSLSHNGRLGIGGPPSQYMFEMRTSNPQDTDFDLARWQCQGGRDARFAIEHYSSVLASSKPIIAFRRARGSIVNPVNVQSGDGIGLFHFWGYNDGWTVGVSSVAEFGAVVDGSPTAGVGIPGRLVFRVGDGSGSNLEVLVIKSSGYVGVRTASPGYTLDVSGDIHCTGKLTSDGGNDPPYVLYNYESRASIIDRVKKEVLPDKLNGAVLFFNGDQGQLELFLPSKGEFRSLDGKVLETVKPITQTFETEDRYYFDENTGEIKSYKARKPARRYRLKPDHELDPKTGKVKRKIKEKKKDPKTGKEIEEIIGEEEVALEEAIELVKEDGR